MNKRDWKIFIGSVVLANGYWNLADDCTEPGSMGALRWGSSLVKTFVTFMVYGIFLIYGQETY